MPHPVLLAGVVLLAGLNLRPAVVGVSPLVGEIRADTGLSSVGVGLLTTLPVLCFGLLAPLGPRWDRRWGLETALLVALVLITTGVLLRWVPVLPALFAGSVVVGTGVAVGNVLIPALIKRDFPHRIGAMTGAYSVTISGGGALAAATVVPIEALTGLGWRAALGLWAGLAASAAVAWTPWVLAARRRQAGTPRRRRGARLLRDRVAWQVTLFMGLQSLHFFALVAWIPGLFIDRGVAPVTAGLLLSLAGVLAVVGSFLLPMLAGRTARQLHLVWGLVGLFVAAYVGLLVAPVGGAPVWMVLVGFAQGGALGLSLTMFSLRTPDAGVAAALSGMAQGVGYTVAAAGPALLGWLRDVSGGWTLPLVVLLGLCLPLLLVGLGAARDVRIEPAPEPPPGSSLPVG